MSDQHIFETDYRGDPNIGMYGFATDSYAVLAREFKLAEKLDVDVHSTYLSNTTLVGVFAAGNSNGVVVSNVATDREVDELRDGGLDVTVIDADHTAVGNLVLCNDEGAYISEHLADHSEEISEALGVPVETGKIADLHIVGSAGIATNQGLLLHREATEDQLATIEDLLGVEGDIGTVNFGSPFVRTGIVATSDRVLVGNDTTGPETARIDEALGFL